MIRGYETTTLRARMARAQHRPLLTPLPIPGVLSAFGDSRAVSVAADGSVTITALPAVVNLVLYRGDDFTMTLTVTDELGDPADLTGAVPLAQIRPNPDGPLSGTFSVTIDQNRLVLHLFNAVSASLPLRCVWDVQITQAGLVTTLAGGTLVLTPDVSRSE